MKGIKISDLPNFDYEDVTIYCDDIGIIVVDLFGFRTVS